MVKPLFPSDTLGLASGNTKEEAILHALCEVIGCDALSMAERGRTGKKTLVLEDKSKTKELLEKFSSAGVQIYLWLLEGRCGIPTVVAAADDPISRDPLLLVLGAGTHPSPEVAATEALVKVARNRAIQLTGSIRVERDRLVEQIGYERMRRFNKAWFSTGDKIDLNEVPDFSSDFIDDDIRLLIDRIMPHTDRIVICDLSVHGIPVVRTIVPRFEVSYIHKDRIRRT
jgi:ribosomal protein S12 methylthiotransferase accessory factor